MAGCWQLAVFARRAVPRDKPLVMGDNLGGVAVRGASAGVQD